MTNLPLLIHNIDNWGRLCMCWGQEYIETLCTFCSVFCYETKNCSKNRIYFKNSMCREPWSQNGPINADNLSYLILKLIKTLKNLTGSQIAVQDFPGGSGVKTLCFLCKGHGFHPGSGGWREKIKEESWEGKCSAAPSTKTIGKISSQSSLGYKTPS